jgi:hypothetical protein
MTQLQDYIAQVRSIPWRDPPNGGDGRQNEHVDTTICNTLGKACRDMRIRGSDPVGPVPDEKAFNACVRYGDDPTRQGHRIAFTHADLTPRNILVNRESLGSGGTNRQTYG